MTNLRSAQSKTGLDVAKQRSHAKIYLFKRMYSNVRLLKLLFNLLGRQKKHFILQLPSQTFFAFQTKKEKIRKNDIHLTSRGKPDDIIFFAKFLFQ